MGAGGDERGGSRPAASDLAQDVSGWEPLWVERADVALLKLRFMFRIRNTRVVVVNRDSKADGRGCAVHNRLTVLRAERGVSRADLARAVSVNPQTIGFIERGDYGPSLEVALRICAHFHLPVEAVFSLEPFTPMSAQLYGTPTGDPR